MAAAKKKALATRKTTSPAAIRDKMRARAAEQAHREKGGEGNFIGTAGGKFKYRGDELPQPLPVVMLDYTIVRSYTGEAPYIEGEVNVPMCTAIGNAEDEMAPVDGCPEPQADLCAECDWNAFRSDKRGRGKACRDLRRVAVIPADSAESITPDAEVAYINVPPSSIKAFRGYMKKIERSVGLPLAGVITHLATEPLEGGHSITFDFVEELDDARLAITDELVDAIQDDLHEPIDTSGYTPYEPPKRGAARRGVGKKSATKKRKF